MGLAEQQQLLARLLTDDTLRARWAADPRAVELELGLPSPTLPDSSTAIRRQVAQFARALAFKRQRAVEKWLPLTHQALGPATFAALFRRYATTHVPSGVRKHHDDALRFCAFLQDRARAELPYRWTVELIRYEAADLAVADAPRHVMLRAFRHDVRAIAAQVLQGDRVRNAGTRPTLALWWRLGPGWRRRAVVFGWPSMQGRPAYASTRADVPAQGVPGGPA